MIFDTQCTLFRLVHSNIPTEVKVKLDLAPDNKLAFIKTYTLRNVIQVITQIPPPPQKKGCELRICPFNQFQDLGSQFGIKIAVSFYDFNAFVMTNLNRELSPLVLLEAKRFYFCSNI